MFNQSSHRRQIALWQIAPFLLIPSALIAAGSLYLGLSLVPFVSTLALTCVVLFVLTMRRPEQEPALRRASAVTPPHRHG